MIITAKFASTCSCCRAPIAVGSKIEWSKGSPARHVACTSGTTALTAATTRPSYTARRSWRSYGGRRTGCSCGSVEGIRRPGDCWECQFDE
jgi:hypothetical protein